MTPNPTSRTRCDRTLAWLDLEAAFASNPSESVRHQVNESLRAQSTSCAWRMDALRIDAPHIHADLSKAAWDEATFASLIALVDQCSVAQHRDAMFGGVAINSTENRQVMHWLPRQSVETLKRMILKSNPSLVSGSIEFDAIDLISNFSREVLTARETLLSFVDELRADSHLPDGIHDVVNIGIGGSDLGPCMVVQALAQVASGGPRVHFVSNVDPFALEQALATCKPANTLFVVQSKTFSTIETKLNAQAAIDWLRAAGLNDIGAHMVAVSMNPSGAKAMGIERVFAMWDWVGGRYSVWSGIGLPVAIALGRAGFEAFLSGAADMDLHFASAPPDRNLPILLGAQDVLYRNFHGFTSRSVAPYAQALSRLPAYLQQLEMESNGKRVDASGAELPFATSAVVWGESGTNGQHAYFQQLHQGTDVVPIEIIAVKQPMAKGEAAERQHRTLLANAVAQAQAFMSGRADAGGHRHFDGGRPSNFFLLDSLTPASLGALIALYEHRVFVAGSLWGINSFDQFGVELGKVLAVDIEKRMLDKHVDGLDASTAALLGRLS